MAKVRTAPRSSPTDVDDVLWCYAKLDDPSTRREGAPTAGAWSMLLWAREARNRFYTSTLPRALAAQAAAEWEFDESGPSEPPTRQEMLECFQDYDLEKKLLRIEGVSDQLISDAEGLVRQWDQETSAKLSAECTVALVSQVASIVHAATLAAAKRPEAFTPYLVDAEARE